MRTKDLPEALRQIGKRSVYTFEQISEMVKKSLLIIDFRLVTHLERHPVLNELKKASVLLAQPQSITTLDDTKFNYFRAQLPKVLN